MMPRMRKALVVIALFLITAAIVSSSWDSSPVGRVQRAIVTGRVSNTSMRDRPWAGASVQLGPERQVLAEDGNFRFAVMPGKYPLKICCSLRFQAIDRELELTGEDVDLNIELTPLTRIEGHVTIERGTEPPRGFTVSASLENSNMVDRAISDIDGEFLFHLTDGKWTLSLDNLPKGYTVASIMIGDQRVQGRTFEIRRDSLGAESVVALPLQITLR